MMLPVPCTAITRAAYFIPANELLQINVGNGGKLRTSPGVVHQAIEAIKAVHSMVDNRLDVGFNGDIGTDEARAIAELLCEFLPSARTAASNHNFGSIGDENLGGASADPASPASYNRNLSFEWQHGNRLLVLSSGEGHKCGRIALESTPPPHNDGAARRVSERIESCFHV
jgi:hypothetical protein